MNTMLASKAVLVVEDDPDLLDSEVELFSSEGYPVLRANNGKVALELLQGLEPAQLPGCIVLDLMMPVMDGATFLQKLLDESPQQLARIPIVVTSAKGTPTGVQEKLPIEAQRVRKPIELDELLAVVASHCG
jgi:CheY-like chemotaxis protein